MDSRIELKKNDKLPFSGMECTVERCIGRGSNAIVYTGRYRDFQDPAISHRVLIRELFPYDPEGRIYRDTDGGIHVEPEAQSLYDLNRMTFLRGIKVHACMTENIPSEIDLNINNYDCRGTLYSLVGYSGGRSLDEDLGRQDPSGKGTEDQAALLRVIRIVKGALDVLAAFHKAGYLHLDISPDNILLIGEGEKERVTLIDYNSVHTTGEIREGRTVYYSTKEGYTAPEVHMSRPSLIRECTDLYSLTAVLYRSLFGKKLSPLQTVNFTLPEKDLRNAPLLKSCPETVLSLIRQILCRGLSVTPRRRYQKAEMLRRDLDELEDRILGRGITRWALWEAGRARILRALKDNTAFAYIRDDNRIYPLLAETEDGEKVSLLAASWFESFRGTAPVLLLGGGGMGKTTALFRIGYGQGGRYTNDSPAIYYISLYGYREGEKDYLCDRLLESLKFKPHTDSMESARRELLQLLDRPLRVPSPLSQNRLPGCGEDGAPAFLLLLDGLNEAVGDTGPLLEEIHRFAALSGVQIILTSRSDPGDPLFRKLSLCRLDHAQIRKILSGEGILPPENMEVFDLLSFPMLLSMYIRTTRDGERQLRLDSREGLLEDYFSSILAKEKRALPEGHALAMGYDAAVRYLLPEIAALAVREGHALSGQELFALIEKCYKELGHRAVTAVYPLWIGHAAELRMGSATADEWYAKAVLDLLWKRLGLLVRDEQGNFRILHQIIEEYLADLSAGFHVSFDREKRRQRRWGLMAGMTVLLLAALAFGAYYFHVNRQLAQRQQDILRNESLALAYSSEAKLKAGHREEALSDAFSALPGEGNERPYVASAQKALADSLYLFQGNRFHPSKSVSWENQPTRSVLSADGRYLAALDDFGTLSCYDFGSGAWLWDTSVTYFRDTEENRWSFIRTPLTGEETPDTVFPFLRILEKQDAVLYVGEKGEAMLLSLATGRELWKLNYYHVPMNRMEAGFPAETEGSTGAVPSQDRADEEYLREEEYLLIEQIETAAVSSDESMLALGVSYITGTDGPSVGSRILLFDTGSGALLLESGLLPVPEGMEFTGRSAFSCNDGMVWTEFREKTDKESADTKDPVPASAGSNSSKDMDGCILGIETESGEPVCSLPVIRSSDEKVRSVSALYDLPSVEMENDDGSVFPGGMLYYLCEYRYGRKTGYSGEVRIGFLQNGSCEWNYYHSFEMVDNAVYLPQIVTGSKYIYVILQREILCLDPKGVEVRYSFDRQVIYSTHGRNSRYLSLIFEDGTTGFFDLPEMEELSAKNQVYVLSEEPLSRGFGSGMPEQPFCVVPASDTGTAILCEYMEDEAIAVLPDPDPVTEKSRAFSGCTVVSPDKERFLYLENEDVKDTESGKNVYRTYGTLYSEDGAVLQRFSFETDVRFVDSSVSFSADGTKIFNGGYLYDIEDHSLTCLDTRDAYTKVTAGDFRSCALEDGVLSAWWDPDGLHIWKDGAETTSAVPGADGMQIARTGYDRRSLATVSSPFRNVVPGENGLIVVLFSNGETIKTDLTMGEPCDAYYLYSLKDASWVRIEGLSGNAGYPFVAAARSKKQFAAVEEDRTLIIYDYDAQKAVQKMQARFDVSAVRDMKFIMEDEYIVLELYSGDLLFQIVRIEDGKTVFSYSPDPDHNPLFPESFQTFEDPEHHRLYLFDTGSSMTGICIDTASWEKLYEIPKLRAVLGNGTCILANPSAHAGSHLVMYPSYSLEEMLFKTRNILSEK